MMIVALQSLTLGSASLEPAYKGLGIDLTLIGNLLNDISEEPNPISELNHAKTNPGD